MAGPVQRIVLAYSGGLDTSVILRWLVERYRAEVVAFSADLGQAEELAGLEEKARRTGATKTIVEDLREEFVRDFVFPMFRAGAIYENQYLLGTSIARPLIAKRQIEIARQERADAVAHGATGKGNDQVRFELTYAALAPELTVIAPWREWDMKGRADLIAYAEQHRIPVAATAEKPYSSDRNLLHVSYEGGLLEDPWRAPYDAMFQLTVAPERAPDRAEEIEVDLDAGVPVAGTGERLAPAALLARLNALAGAHGVGRVDVVENRYVGLKSRGVYETPGGTVLRAAYQAVESLTLDREVLHLRDALVPSYAEMVYYGYWFAPERVMLQAAIDEAARAVTGTARLHLYRGSERVIGRKAPRSLYDPKLVSFDEAGGDRQEDAGRVRFVRSEEDIHMAIERRLTELLGPVGGKLHTGRSRNDQVALDLRLWLRAECDALDAALARLQRALTALARRYRDALLPGYTHLQRAQPILLAHHLLAYRDMLARDRTRLRDCRARADELPLGAGALAGAGFPLDRKFVARQLGFARVTANSVDAVADRDAAAEFLAAAAICAVHLSRLAEELVLWATEEFGFVELPDGFATGRDRKSTRLNSSHITISYAVF